MDLFDFEEPVLPFELPDGNGYSVRWNEDHQGHHVVIPNGELFYAEHYFNKKLSDRCVSYFQENGSLDWRNAQWRELSVGEFSRIEFANIKWKQDRIKLYGKDIPLPRLTSWYGDAGKSYTYSGISSNPNEWNDGLRYLKKIEQCAELEFNSVLMNWYRDGEDYINWHADNEKELGRNPVVASANFGATRDFVIRNKVDRSVKIKMPLKHGTLLVMRGELQHFWEHAVPKRKKVMQSRINLTFRRIGL